VSRGASGVLTGVQAAQVIGVANYSLRFASSTGLLVQLMRQRTHGRRDGARDNGD
jgi:hypothetical protein